MASLLVSRAASRVLAPPTYSPLLISRAATRSRSLITLSGGGGGDPRLAGLRSAMAAAGVDAFVVPSGDPHLSEYVHPCYERRAFVSGFTGSAGTAVITRDAALLWTDGRYFLQAEGELRGLSQAECVAYARWRKLEFIGVQVERTEFGGCVVWNGRTVEYNADKSGVGCGLDGNGGACLCTVQSG